jgi:hypothetical protein
MFQEYMTNMGLRRMPDGTCNRLMLITPDNPRELTEYIYVMTRV